MPRSAAILGRNDCVFGVRGRHSSVSNCGSRDGFCHGQCFSIALLCASGLQPRLNRDPAVYEQQGLRGSLKIRFKRDNSVADEPQERFDYWGSALGTSTRSRPNQARLSRLLRKGFE